MAVENIRTQSMLLPGDAVGAFRVVKIGGAVEDGVSPGEDLCYRCRYGSRPMVMIFARQNGPGLVTLVKRLDAAIASHQDGHLRGLLTFIGDEPSNLTEVATQCVSESEVKWLPITIADDAATGPANYYIPPGAPITIVIAQDSQVVQASVFSNDDIDTDAIMDVVTAMVP